MTHRWQQTIHIDATLAQILIKQQFQIPVHTILPLDAGWDNIVYQVNDNLIFRFPRRDFGIMCMENEIAILPRIAPQISFPFSCPVWIGQACDLYAYPFAGYPMLTGTALCDAASSLVDDSNFATTLAGWLKELHAIPVNLEVAGLIKGCQSWRTDINHRTSRALENCEHYEKYFLHAGFSKASLYDLIERMSHYKFPDLKQSFLHGDLYSRHILVNPTMVSPTGVIDWGDVHIGDPGIDLAISMIFTESAYKVFLDTYGKISDTTRKLALFHAFFHTISFLPYAYEQNKQSLKDWSRLVLLRVISEAKKELC